MERITTSAEYDHITRKKVTDRLIERFSCLSLSVIGKSCAGRDIPLLRVGSGEEYVLFAAAFHGSEHITSNILFYFIEELCYAYENDLSLAGIKVRKALFGRGLLFVPCVNPDGCEISVHEDSGCGAFAETVGKLCKKDYKHWNANLRGVDINHNFDAGWKELHRLEQRNGIYGPSPTRYGGPFPESEPETAALCSLCRERRIHHVMALHSQGEVIYWSYGDRRPLQSKKMAEILATCSGYALDTPVGIAEGGGFKDWFIKEFNRPGFTVEVGSGENPLPIDEAFGIYQDVKELLMLSAIL